MAHGEVLSTVEELKSRLATAITAAGINHQEEKIVKILKKLSLLSMSLEVLKETQVGKQVNSLRKWGGKVSSKAKSLVKKWKLLLLDSEETYEHMQTHHQHQHLHNSQHQSHEHHHRHHHHSSVIEETEQESMPVIHVERSKEEVEVGSRPKRTFKERPVGCRHVEDEFSKALSMPVVSRKSRSSGGGGVMSRVGREAGSEGRSKETAGLGDGLLLRTSLSPQAKPTSRMSREVSPVPAKAAREPCSGTKRRVAELDGLVIGQSKRSRTQVYSGKKTTSGPQVVSSLFDLCMRILIDNIDVIEEVGPSVPYHVLEPLLVKCSAMQLMKLEDYNPHLIEDTDKLWNKHVVKDFKETQLPQGLDWREFYREKLAEREEKLRNLTARIKANNHAREEPVRKVKLAEVSVKPGRRSGPRTPSFLGRSSRGGFHRAPMERPHAGSNLMKRTLKMAKERNHMMTFKLGK